ncbi:hypothetical protein B0H16DRAFT_1458948 [Mycena metata]|uniref:Uncharacterized protein n=1 Tax=Mycena metata TaxID=1033252 RepID=A0AAD7J285_9AGAR|nr:hypothetical protein B0H16DRAFT_1458948 [Mycena metata]
MALALALVLGAPLLVDAAAYTWSFGAQPTQCGNVSISVSGGSPPYEVLVVPYGSSPLPNNIEARKIQAVQSSSANISFKLNFPANSQFVAVVSDSTGFGSGGTSVGVEVTSSSDSSCFDASKMFRPTLCTLSCPQTPSFNASQHEYGSPQSNAPFKVGPINGTRGVIPGGDSFEIPQGAITNVPAEGTGFNWTAPLRGMTTLLLVGGDDRGNGTAGSTLYIVGSGDSNDNSCLNSASPVSTTGSPAGGSYSTSTSGAGTGGGSGGSSGGGSGSSGGGSGSSGGSGGSKTNVGAIAGGVVGGVAGLLAIVLIALFFIRRRRLGRQEKVRPDLLNDERDEGDEGGATRNELPQFYQPEPFTAGRSSVGGLTADDRHPSDLTDEHGRPISGVFSEGRSETPDPSTSMSTSTRKTAPMRQMRPVNIIQHADAGPSLPAQAGEEEPETVELPPAYTNIRKEAAAEA